MTVKPGSLVFIAAAVSTLVAVTTAHAETYVADPSHTFVNFEAKHNKTSTSRGRFDKKEGTVTIDPASKTGKAEFTIQMASVSTGMAALDTHLKSKDFFKVEENPTATFTSDSFSFDSDTVQKVNGSLTMMGKTLPVTLTANHFNCYESRQLKRPVCGGDFETTIQRSQWGIDYGLQYGLPDDIRLLIQVEAVKQ